MLTAFVVNPVHELERALQRLVPQPRVGRRPVEPVQPTDGTPPRGLELVNGHPRPIRWPAQRSEDGAQPRSGRDREGDGVAPVPLSYQGSIVMVIPDTLVVMVMRKPVFIGSSSLFEIRLRPPRPEGASGFENTVALIHSCQQAAQAPG